MVWLKLHRYWVVLPRLCRKNPFQGIPSCPLEWDGPSGHLGRPSTQLLITNRISSKLVVENWRSLRVIVGMAHDIDSSMSSIFGGFVGILAVILWGVYELCYSIAKAFE